LLDVAASMPNPAALPRRFEKIIAAKGYRVWKPTINADTSGTLICEDSDDDAVYSKAIPLTDGKHQPGRAPINNSHTETDCQFSVRELGAGSATPTLNLSTSATML
jgi:hypothetical protein